MTPPASNPFAPSNPAAASSSGAHPTNAPGAGVPPLAASARIASGQAWLVDVREVDEYRREHVAGSALCPTSVVAPDDMPPARNGQTMLVMCRSGTRAGRVVDALRAAGRNDALVLEGGIVAWAKAGLPVKADARTPLTIMRQVMITVGALGLVFTVLAAVASPWWLLGTGALGAGLLFAGVTGMCALAAVLGKMPWNRSGGKAAGAVGAALGAGAATGGTSCSTGTGCGSCG